MRSALKRAATGLLYIVGAVSIGYLALYAYAVWRGERFTPGDPIKLFRKDDAPSYS